MTEKFKGDDTELKYVGAFDPLLDITDLAHDEMYAGAYESAPYLLMLFDEGRVPFSDRINRNAFVDFINETFKRFPFIGNFDTYLFILRAIFGQLSEINFTVPSPGKLIIDVNATSNLEFDFIGREADGTIFEVIDNAGDILTFRGVAGIETEYELELLFAEIMPAGITPEINLTFFTRYDFIAWDAIDEYEMITNDENQLIFFEIG